LTEIAWKGYKSQRFSLSLFLQCVGGIWSKNGFLCQW